MSKGRLEGVKWDLKEGWLGGAGKISIHKPDDLLGMKDWAKWFWTFQGWQQKDEIVWSSLA